MKRLAVLGSTGSIGRNTLNVVNRFPEHYQITALAAKENVDLLARQITQFSPRLAVVFDQVGAEALKERLPSGTAVDILYGEAGYQAAATDSAVDMVISAVVGAAGLMPTLAAIDAGKTIGLANKETLVMAGAIVMQAARKNGVRILPIDSEHSAIFQCLEGHRRADLAKIILTASGGPFRERPKDTFAEITLQDALNHPTWQMGRKISIDSATLMNKGLEVIEARWLFDVSPEMIEVVVHPQSIIHSMVAYHDGSLIAQLGLPDMRGAIAYALSYPGRLPLHTSAPDFAQIGALTFDRPDLERFPCLGLAFDACKTGGTLPAVLNAANEAAVNAFLHQRIAFVHIPEVVRRTMQAHRVVGDPTLSAVLEADHWARLAAQSVIEAFEKNKSEGLNLT